MNPDPTSFFSDFFHILFITKFYLWESQKQPDPADPDPQHWYERNYYLYQSCQLDSHNAADTGPETGNPAHFRPWIWEPINEKSGPGMK
jgi:hypothetical protein